MAQVNNDLVLDKTLDMPANTSINISKCGATIFHECDKNIKTKRKICYIGIDKNVSNFLVLFEIISNSPVRFNK